MIDVGANNSVCGFSLFQNFIIYFLKNIHIFNERFKNFKKFTVRTLSLISVISEKVSPTFARIENNY